MYQTLGEPSVEKWANRTLGWKLLLINRTEIEQAKWDNTRRGVVIVALFVAFAIASWEVAPKPEKPSKKPKKPKEATGSDTISNRKQSGANNVGVQTSSGSSTDEVVSSAPPIQWNHDSCSPIIFFRQNRSEPHRPKIVYTWLVPREDNFVTWSIWRDPQYNLVYGSGFWCNFGL